MTTVAQYDAAIINLEQTGAISPDQEIAFIGPAAAAPPPVQVAELTPVQQYEDAVQQIQETGSFNPNEFGTPGVDLAPVAASTWVEPAPDYYDAPYELQPQPVMYSPDVFGG